MSAYRDFTSRRGRELMIRPPGEARAIYTDLYDEARDNLIEAQDTVSREAIRMAIGQLADYRRFVEPAPCCPVLVPERPQANLAVLLESQGISIVWQAGSGFEDDAGGRFL